MVTFSPTALKVMFVVLVLILPMLTGFAILFFSVQHSGLGLNLRPWTIALVALFILSAMIDARYTARAGVAGGGK
jgi:hypothetical protein